ncbi:unnamed protein product [Orchesella dallaii]|uniref:Uncharacterized protein n=1 Tax=Orchesella dallaii TaxID=48710 RepID=A0ABP1RMT2_9HEXA
MFADIINDLKLKELELKTVVQEREHLKSVLAEMTRQFETYKLKSSERESNLATQLSKVKAEYKTDIQAAYNHIEEIEGKLKSVANRNRELLSENTEIRIKLKGSNDLKKRVAQTSKSIIEMNQELINLVEMDSSLSQLKKYESEEELQLAQPSASAVRSGSPLFTRRTPPPQHSRDKRKSKRKSRSCAYDWVGEDQNDGYKKVREEINEASCHSVPATAITESHLKEFIAEPAVKSEDVSQNLSGLKKTVKWEDCGFYR